MAMTWQLSDALTPAHEALLAARGLDVRVLEDQGVVTARPSSGNGDWVAIPFVVDGKVHSHKYRTISGEKKFSQDKGKRRVFYNHDVIKNPALKDHPLVITEGEIDALTALGCGIQRVVSFPDGAAMPNENGEDRGGTRKFAFIDSYERVLKPVRKIILATDADEPGAALLQDLANKLGRGRCHWVKYPKGCKDLNDVLLKHGPDAVRDCIDNSQGVKVDGWYRMWDIPPRAEMPIFENPIPGMGKHCKIRRGDFWVISGIPGSGKSCLVIDIACRMAMQHGWRITVGTWEAYANTDFRRYIRVWFNRKPEDQQSQAEKDRSDAWMAKHFSFIIPSEDDDMNVDWVLDKCETAVSRFETHMVILDPWNEMEHLPDPRENMANYVGFAIRRFKAFAKSREVLFAVVAHPRKMAKGEDGFAMKPSLYDISDSAAWANKSDVGIIVHRGDGTTALIDVQKVKFHDILGKPGPFNANYDPTCNRYFPIAPDPDA